MRVLLFLGLTLLPAAPADLPRPPAVAPVNPPEARAYAQQLGRVINQVSAHFVRPVSRAELYRAALTGLYEAVNLPVPEEMAGELAKLIKDPKAAEGEEEAALDRLGDDESIIAVIARYRQALGDREPIRGQAALRVSIQAMVANLDPYSKLVTGDELRRGNGQDTNHGLGIELDPDQIDGPARIKAVVLGSPAQRAGLRPGDQITHVGATALAGAQQRALLLATVVDRPDDDLRKTAGKIHLTVQPTDSATPRRLALERTYYRAETVLGVRRDLDGSWDHMLDEKEKIGYVRIGSLDHGTADQLLLVLGRLKAHDMRGLILDLRWSPGGFLNEAVMVARCFLKQGAEVAQVRSRINVGRGQGDQVYKADVDSPFDDFPLVVLVNGETMGGAELIAASLRDNKRALIAGQRTFGKASVQSLLASPVENAELKLTTGNFFRPSGKALHRFPDSKEADDWGVRPERHLEMRLSPALSKQLKEWWLLQSLRPPRNDQAQPLDDPENDTQREVALRGLRKLLK